LIFWGISIKKLEEKTAKTTSNLLNYDTSLGPRKQVWHLGHQSNTPAIKQQRNKPSKTTRKIDKSRSRNYLKRDSKKPCYLAPQISIIPSHSLSYFK
jgi:hypothetical protein